MAAAEELAKQLAEAQQECEELRSELSVLKEESVSGVLPSRTGSRLCGICSIHGDYVHIFSSNCSRV